MVTTDFDLLCFNETVIRCFFFLKKSQYVVETSGKGMNNAEMKYLAFICWSDTG